VESVTGSWMKDGKHSDIWPSASAKGYGHSGGNSGDDYSGSQSWSVGDGTRHLFYFISSSIFINL
jgi:hypothetical protein